MIHKEAWYKEARATIQLPLLISVLDRRDFEYVERLLHRLTGDREIKVSEVSPNESGQAYYGLIYRGPPPPPGLIQRLRDSGEMISLADIL